MSKDDYDEKDATRSEARINALLDGELSEEAAQALQRDAARDHALAQAIVEAYRLQRDMEALGSERAPASLRRRLKRIPREQAERPRWLGSRVGSGAWPRWVTLPALASVPLIVIAVALMQPARHPEQPRQPTAAEVAQARQDLALAFDYLDRVAFRTSEEIQQVVGGELRRNVKDVLSEHIPYTEQHRKEDAI